MITGIKIWWHETYWSCRFISAYALLERARTPEQKYKAKLAVVLALTYLGKYDFSIAEFARFTRMQFAEEETHAANWV